MFFNESGRQTKPTGEGGKEQMIALNDYLYSGDTVLRILQKYSSLFGKLTETSEKVVIYCNILS